MIFMTRSVYTGIVAREKNEARLIDNHDLDVGLRDRFGAAFAIVDDRHLAEDAAGRNCLEHLAAQDDFHFAGRDHIHDFAVIAGREEPVPLREQLGNVIAIDRR